MTSNASYSSFPNQQYRQMANAIRALTMDAVEKAKSGHPGMPMGMADVATVLFADFVKFNPEDPLWPDRDRFLLSNGHGVMLQYALAYLTGYKEMTLQQLQHFRQLGSMTPGHPELHRQIGIETTTGPLGQGIGNAAGMALAECIMAAQFGEDLVNHYTYVFVGDGCLMEGISHEVGSLAGHLQLGKLIVCFDDNDITIDGPTNLATSDDHLKRFQSYGWHTQAIDGHDPQQIHEALSLARRDQRPSLIACKTIIGYGAPSKSGKAESHGTPLGPDEVKRTRDFLNWAYPSFEIPSEILQSWRQVSQRCLPAYRDWHNALKQKPDKLQHEYERRQKGDLPQAYQELVYDKIRAFTESQPAIATRESSGEVITALMDGLSELIGGSADLSDSNNTKAKQAQVITRHNHKGNYVHYGVREHGMAAMMNGLALHNGVIPYGGSFLTFTDYCRPSIRLAAMMEQRVIYVMTHDSIGLGEDGPTHQPIEHLASLRAIPNLLVLRPADPIEVAECWMVALEQKTGPSLLALTRQKVPTLRHTFLYGENLCKLGAYVMRESRANNPRVNLLATGSEVALALEAQHILEEEGIETQVVSMPCWELFDQQPAAYKESVLSKKALRIAIEAASSFGWERYVEEREHIIGMTSFGASAPYHALYQHFGLTVDNIVKLVKQQL